MAKVDKTIGRASSSKSAAKSVGAKSRAGKVADASSRVGKPVMGRPGGKQGIEKSVIHRDIRLDAKKRATLTGAEFDYYRMTKEPDGTIILAPLVLAPATISARTLSMMDRSIVNFAQGEVGDAIDFGRYEELNGEG